MNRDERKERRRRISAEVKAGKPIDQVAQKFGVSDYTVKCACSEFGVPMPAGARRIGDRSLRIIARGFNPDVSVAEIAKEFDVTHQHVSFLLRDATLAGIPGLPPRSRGRSMG